jgi:hypothetical protein
MNLKLLKGLVDMRRISLYLFFLKDQEKVFSLTELSEKAKIPVASTMRIMRDILENSLVEVVMVGKIKLYKCANNQKVMELQKVLNSE